MVWPGGFEYEGPAAVSNDEAAEIPKRAAEMVAVPALAKLRTQIEDDLDR